MKMKKRTTMLLLALWFSCAGMAAAQQKLPLLQKRLNRFDKHGERQGRWKIYLDDANTILMNKGRYKRGRMAGTWRYYDTDGKLERVERYRRRSRLIYTTRYHPNGRVAGRGKAALHQEEGLTHYYWFGPWEFYSENGDYLKTELYRKGKPAQLVWVR